MFKHRYTNGLTLIVDPSLEFQSVAVGAWVKTGTRFENPSEAGISHFMEHMLFKGKKRKSAVELAKAVDQVGGDFNAFTTREHTCFHMHLPANEAPLAAKMLKDLFFRPLLALKDIEHEREVVLQEIAMVSDTAEEEASDRFLENYFGSHSLGRNILGTPESIHGLDRKKLFAYLHRYYRPENIVISVSGKITEQQAKKIFADLGKTAWPHRNKPLLPLNWGSDPPVGPVAGAVWKVADTEQVHLVWGTAASAKNKKERAVLLLLQNHLGGGMSSVLFDEIREKRGLGYSVYANEMTFLDAVVFSVYAGVKRDGLLTAVQIVQRELRRLTRELISSKDLARLKNGAIGHMHLAMENTESRMVQIAQNELFYRREVTFKEIEESIRRVRANEILACANRWFRKSPQMWFFFGPKPKRSQMKETLEQLGRLTGTPVKFTD